MSTTIEDLFDSIEEVASEAVEAQQLLHTVEDELLKLKRENKKLRELVRDLYNRLNDSDENCGECRSDCGYDAWNFGDPKCIYAKRMRELGIEAKR